MHTGSIHIVAVRDAAAARLFAEDEPYQRAELFADTAISRFVNLLGRSMWDRPRPPDRPRSTFLTARWPAILTDARAMRAVRDAVQAQPDIWAFLGLLVTDDGTGCIGVAAAADAEPGPAELALRAVLEALQKRHAEIDVHRWERGGRR